MASHFVGASLVAATAEKLTFQDVGGPSQTATGLLSGAEDRLVASDVELG
eukprot:CAMPEP_0197451006 /NCGR_PEP_ID=MMETSP1175-20131217/27343_1 /TAXON_ID=1003142 /ORGANISM="Triceratium dubium, Strain CCMP147" /LENGTH=49 /DNA_ID= /DNA_START= /DNA_END= /DNA_ORIENTATION=